MLYATLSIIALLLAIIASGLIFSPEKTRRSLRGMRALIKKYWWVPILVLVGIARLAQKF